MRVSKPRSTVLHLAVTAHVGRILFAVAILGFGAEYILLGYLADGLPPLPGWIPFAQVVAWISGAVLTLTALELIGGWRVHRASLWLSLVLGVCALTHLRNFDAVVLHDTPRTAFLEPLAFAAAALVLRGLYDPRPRNFASGAGQVLFACTLMIFGLQHFLGFRAVSALVPAWVPYPNFWTIATGAGMIVAGIAIITGIAARMAGLSLATMFLLWLAALHLPLLVQEPRNPDLYASALVALGMGGASLLIAESAHSNEPLEELPRVLLR